MWNDFIHNFCREYDYPTEAENAFITAAEEITKNSEVEEVFENCIKSYSDMPVQENLESCLEKIKSQVGKIPVPSDTIEYLFFMLCTDEYKKLNKQKGYPDNFFANEMIDMRCKLFECYNVKGIWGSFVSLWFVRFFTFNRFAIGRLQYEIETVPKTVSLDGRYVFSGEKAVNVHIPSMGPLKIDEVKESLKNAAVFFADEFEGEQVPFMCHSWLLFPGHYTMLPEKSGIRNFMEEFTIIRFDLDESEHDLWRIYNTFDTSDRDKLPCKTSLQRAYKDWLKAGKPVGEGLGIKYLPKVQIK